MLTPLLYTSLAATLLILLTPLLVRQLTHQTIITCIKLAFITSLIPTTLFLTTGLQTSTLHLTWAPLNFNMKISFLFDAYSITFIPIAMLITWTIMEFSQWYMAHEPDLTKFTKFLMLFLMAMLTLTSANNMFQLFIGWEGVGIMSFLLIGWWHGRTAASTSALQAVIYNRIGDIGLLLTMAWVATNLSTWDIQQLLAHPTTPTLPLIGLILAATGKSAQFGLHPWLPAAMEGPTPVSALLHSSTMVVAGIFLLIRLHPLLHSNPTALSTCLCLGATTTTFAAMCALTQNDIKKIIAFSTTSQLGLMMLTLGLNHPLLTFLHITTHAFFKAMLFLCSGSIIHALDNEQDIRKMGGIHYTMPVTSSCMSLGSLALIGTPFLAGFYTKDTIIETMNTSTINAWALLTTTIATALTAAYSLRLMFYTQLANPRHQPASTLTETSTHQTAPLLRLAGGSITMGLLMTTTFTPTQALNTTMPPLTKLAALLATLMGLLLALDLVLQTTHLVYPHQTISHTTLTNLLHFNTLLHRQLPTSATKTGNLTLYLNDHTWYELVGPTTLTDLSSEMAAKLANYHTGTLKTYLMTPLLLLTTAMPIIYGTR